MHKCWSVRWVLGLLVVAGLGLPAITRAAHEAPSLRGPDTGLEAVFEPARRSVRASTQWLARGVDSWFGDKPFSSGGAVSDGLLSVFWLKRRAEAPDVSLRFSARFALPNLEERAYVFLARDDTRDAVTDLPDALSRRQRLVKESGAEAAFFAGLGFAPRDSLQLRLGFHDGLKPYAHARYRHTWQLDEDDRIDLRETVFWGLDAHLGSTTVLSYEHGLTPTLALRWLNAATITQASKVFEWSSSLGTYQSFGRDRLLSLEALCSGIQGSDVPATDIGLQLKWEQPIHQDWLIGEVLLGHFWPRPDALSERSRAWAMGAALKMKF